MNEDRILYGWRVRSELALPNLAAWPGGGREPDVEIVTGDLPEPDSPSVVTRPYWQAWADGTYRLNMPGVGRYQAIQGCRVVIEPAQGADENDIRVFLLGTLVGILCYQRGLFPLHASAVRMDGRAVMISGVSGAGKSTLSAALGRRGHGLIADDVVAIGIPGTGPLQVLPAFPVHKLARDVMTELMIDSAGLTVNRPGQAKYLVPSDTAFDSAPVVPHALYLISRVFGDEPSAILRPPAAECVGRVESMAYRRGVGLAITPAGTLFRAAAALTRSIPVHVLKVNDADPLSALDKLAAMVETHARGLTPR